MVKPYIKSGGNMKKFFSHVILLILSLTTLFLMWFLLIKCLNLSFAFATQLGIFNLISISGGLNNISSDISSEGIVKTTTVDKYELDSLKYKIPESKNLGLKIYDSIFSTKNKQIITINPFPIVKDAFLKTSNINVDANNFNPSVIDNSSDNVHHGIQNTVSLKNISQDNVSLHSSISDPSSLDGVVIDIKIFKGIDGFNQKYILLKDLNDPSSSNLINILENPNIATMCYDKDHVQSNNCTNHKYLSFEHKYTSTKYEKRVNKTLPLNAISNNSLQEVSFTINNPALSEIHKNRLIVESENLNRLPVKNSSSFASGENISNNK